MKKHHLLSGEDDEMVQGLLAAFLESEGFRVSLASTGKEMLALLDREEVSLILLDLGLPDEDGLALARQVRARSSLPIIVLTARKGRDDRLLALELGVDDYLTKPADPRELLLRVRNVLGRASADGGGRGPAGGTRLVEFGGWTVDVSARALTDPDGRDVSLTRAEFNLLAALTKAPNRVLSRDFLLDAISRDADSPSQRMIDVLVSRLRKKIEADPKKPEWIVTVPGCGYKFTLRASAS
ncbi:MAG: response regulator transcription factor [Proteobacteria bacterium]|nr:response regulator transcription factor [Pseudomonadota bacterium]